MKRNTTTPVDYGSRFFPPLDHAGETRLVGIAAPLPNLAPVVALKSSTQTEHEVCEDLKAWWKAHEFFVIRNQQGIGSKKGLSDYTVIKDGRVAFVEAKATKGKQNDNQIAFQAGVEREGGTYILAHSLHEFVAGWDLVWKQSMILTKK